MSSSRPAVKSRILVVFDCMTLQAARKRVEDNILTVLNGFSMGEVSSTQNNAGLGALGNIPTFQTKAFLFYFSLP